MELKTTLDAAVRIIADPAIIVPVRLYANETEPEALIRAGIDPEEPGVIVEYIYMH